MVQRAPAAESKSERYAFAAGKKTYAQKCRAIYREALRSLLELCKRYFAEGKSCDEVLEVLMPVRHEAQGRNERTAKASSSMSLYRQAMSRWVVAMKGCKLIVKQLTLKGTGEACAPRSALTE